MRKLTIIFFELIALISAFSALYVVAFKNIDKLTFAEKLFSDSDLSKWFSGILAVSILLLVQVLSYLFFMSKALKRDNFMPSPKLGSVYVVSPILISLAYILMYSFDLPFLKIIFALVVGGAVLASAICFFFSKRVKKDRFSGEQSNQREHAKARGDEDTIAYSRIRSNEKFLFGTNYLVIDSNIFMGESYATDAFFTQLKKLMRERGARLNMSRVQYDEIYNKKRRDNDTASRIALKRIEDFLDSRVLELDLDLTSHQDSYLDLYVIEFAKKCISKNQTFSVLTEDRDLRTRLKALNSELIKVKSFRDFS